MRKSVLPWALVALLLAGGAALAAGRPVKDVSARRHPNLAAAQKSCQRAYERIVAAQKANEWDMDGHAQKAKDLLEEASAEIKLAAEAANHPTK